MICPFCQHDLDVETLSCPRCHTEFPRSGKPFGFGIRTAAAAFLMMTLMSLILVDCVLNWLPGGPDSLLPTGSAQLPNHPLPNMKSPEVNTLMNQWASGQQAVPLPKFVTKH